MISIRNRRSLAIKSIAEALFCETSGPPPAERLQWLSDDFDDFLAHAGTRARLILLSSLAVVSWVGPLLVFRPPVLRWLSLEARTRALDRVERAPLLSLALLAVKASLCILYYEHPAVAASIGVDTDCLVESP